MGKYKNSNSYIDTGKTNSQNSPSGTEKGELAKNTPKRLETLDDICPICGGNYLAPWPDNTPGYYCKDCHPNFNQEVE